MEAIQLHNESLNSRRSFVGMDDSACRRLKTLAPALGKAINPALDAAYIAIRATPELRRMFRDDAHMDNARDAQKAHWLEITQASFGPRYAASAHRIGAAHVRIGLDPRWYIGSYSLVLESLVTSILTAGPRQGLFARISPSEKAADVSVVIKAALLDLEMSVSAYLKIDEDRRKAEADQTHALDILADALAEVASGKLSITIDPSISQKSKHLVSSFNRATGSLREIILRIRESSAKIQTAANEIALATDNLAQRTEQQAASLEETSASLGELTRTIRETAERAGRADATVTAARIDAEKGGQVIEQTRSAMERIESSSSQMSQIIGVIDEIAFQTNLLALNAGVEAARAGDAGRGFAVVASEVRSLAQRSAEAARTIKTLIGSSSDHVRNGVSLVEGTSEVLVRVVHAFSEINDLVSNMASVAKGQATSIAELNSAVGHLDQMTQQNATMVEESSAACASLAQESRDLSGFVNKFRIES